MRNSVRYALLRLAGTRRIHVIGCSRSGTTMIHYAMAAFDRTHIHHSETSVEWHPSLLDSAKLLASPNRIYVTKRAYGWFGEQQLNHLIRAVTFEGVGIIHMIRDPRDVLTSRHAENGGDPYVEPSQWAKSMDAAEAIKQVALTHRFLTLRYEDVVSNPGVIQSQISEAFELEMRPGMSSFSDLADNVLGLGIEPGMAKAMHRLRNFDRNSIGKWKRSESDRVYIEGLLRSPYAEGLCQFMSKHGYA